MISKVNIIGKFQKSDHSLLQRETVVMVASKRTFRPTLDYGKAGYPLMKKELRSMGWKMVMQGSTEECWTKFKNIINDVVSRKLEETQSERSQEGTVGMTNKAVQLVRKNIRHLRSIRTLFTQLASEQQKQQIKKLTMPKF